MIRRCLLSIKFWLKCKQKFTDAQIGTMKNLLCEEHKHILCHSYFEWIYFFNVVPKALGESHEQLPNMYDDRSSWSRSYPYIYFDESAHEFMCTSYARTMIEMSCVEFWNHVFNRKIMIDRHSLENLL